MVPDNLSQTYMHKQQPCSILSLFVITYDTKYYQHNYFLYYKPNFIINPTKIDFFIPYFY